ncbi:MAG: DMT family transporter [Pseudomonadota bacterium]
MENDRAICLASTAVLVIGTLWGFYWLPVREIANLGLTGVWGTLAITAAGTVALLPFAWTGRAELRQADFWAVAATALGGFAFVLYSVSFLYGEVAVVIILFFLTPVWSTLLGRIFFGWPITRTRASVLVLGILGLLVMLGAEGNVPIPRNLGEWLGLASGFFWSVASLGIRVRRALPAVQGGFVFAAGATLGGLALAPWLGGWTDSGAIGDGFQLFLWVLLTGGFWWALFIVGLMWATPQLDPARVGILLMAEVLVAAVSAALIVGEHLSVWELVGGALVLAAGLLELRPTRVLANGRARRR